MDAEFGEKFGGAVRKGAQAKPIYLDGDKIAAQVKPEILYASSMTRPSDVRLILKTVDLKGVEHSFPNHGLPENDPSTVAFDGQNGMMCMLNGETPHEQVFFANQVARQIEAEGLENGVTPDFIQRHIVNPEGSCRPFIKEMYGPAPFEGQAGRLEECQVIQADGTSKTFTPRIENSFAIGTRAPVEETAMLVYFTGDPQELYMKGGEATSMALDAIEKQTDVKMKGTNTTSEKLDGRGVVVLGIVLAVDAVTGNTKPIRLETARGIFDFNKLNHIQIDAEGTVLNEHLDSDNLPKLQEYWANQTPEGPSGIDLK